uniref:Right handed beta helix domain-containing protein n=1 Tax=Lotharella globosa TaxID=91324 RepID=A0A7S4DVH8_9EUKA
MDTKSSASDLLSDENPAPSSHHLRAIPHFLRSGANDEDKAAPPAAAAAAAAASSTANETESVEIEVEVGGDIQKALDEAQGRGGGVVLVKNGRHVLKRTLSMRPHVVLRGESREGVVLAAEMHSGPASSGRRRGVVVRFGEEVRRAALERVTIDYTGARGTDPVDMRDFKAQYRSKCFKNNPHQQKDLYVTGICFADGAENNWVDDCSIFRMGTNPVVFAKGSCYNTLRNTFVDRCYNKGDNKNGVVDLQGTYNLITGCTVKRIRGIVLHGGAQYNVLYANSFEVPVCFSAQDGGDGGENLMEANSVRIPRWHLSRAFFATNDNPGTNNIIFKNKCLEADADGLDRPFSDPDVIYSFQAGVDRPVRQDAWSLPPSGTFYAEKENGVKVQSASTRTSCTTMFTEPVTRFNQFCSNTFQSFRGTRATNQVRMRRGVGIRFAKKAARVTRRVMCVRGLAAGMF